MYIYFNYDKLDIPAHRSVTADSNNAFFCIVNHLAQFINDFVILTFSQRFPKNPL